MRGNPHVPFCRRAEGGDSLRLASSIRGSTGGRQQAALLFGEPSRRGRAQVLTGDGGPARGALLCLRAEWRDHGIPSAADGSVVCVDTG